VERSSFEKLTVAQPLKKLLTFYAVGMFIIAFRRTHQWTLSWSDESSQHAHTLYL